MMTEAEKSEYFELLKFKSIGVDTSCLKDCVETAMWFKSKFSDIGFSAQLVLPEGENGPPCVYAERIVAEDAPTVLIYGHYDVQPPDPLELWLTDPFVPTEKDGRVYCRGAQDDKGQFFALFCGMRRYLAANATSKVNIKVLLEGQEESGGQIIYHVAEMMSRRLKADVLLVSDTTALPELKPTVIAGLRGVTHFTIKLTGANRDLHSGIYGGVAPNAAQGIIELLNTLHDKNGAIAVDGFLDHIQEPTEQELQLAEKFAPTKTQIEEDIGCEPCGGEKNKSLVVRNSFHPTIEINGVHSGYGGPGSKTVIPNFALAKISMRLVPGQSPKAAFEAVKTHLEKNCPQGMKLSVEDASGFSEGFRLPLDTPLFRLAEGVLEEIDSRGAGFLWEGASIPCVSMLSRISGASPLLVGWGQKEDAIHSPNESFSYEQFDKASKWGELILSALDQYMGC
ncbi:MAG: M20/M25/M40 family metallo-hydrolase [Kiritimatiellae bacterium]|nr:M20/M25/M40 family metallo-hydrolase [Kiritimatiellia bacterium]